MPNASSSFFLSSFTPVDLLFDKFSILGGRAHHYHLLLSRLPHFSVQLQPHLGPGLITACMRCWKPTLCELQRVR